MTIEKIKNNIDSKLGDNVKIIYNGSRRHSQHTAQIDAIHLFPSERHAYEHAHRYHAQDNGTRCNDRGSAYLHQFLKTEFQA